MKRNDWVGGGAAMPTRLAFTLCELRQLPRASVAARRCFISHGALTSALPVLALALCLPASSPATAAPQTYADRLHTRALESFRAGRFSEAYGRFVELANLEHPASARYALWMCEQGVPLFDKPWDCSQQEIGDWAAAAGVAPFRLEQIMQPNRTAAAQPVRR